MSTQSHLELLGLDNLGVVPAAHSSCPFEILAHVLRQPQRKGRGCDEWKGVVCEPIKVFKRYVNRPLLVAVIGDWNNRKQTPKSGLMGRIYHELKHCMELN